MHRNDSLQRYGLSAIDARTLPVGSRPLLRGLVAVLVLAVALMVSGLASANEQDAGGGEARSQSLTLNQAIEMALDNNLNVVVSRLGTQAQVEGLLSARGVYKPTLAMNISNSASVSPANNQLIGAETLDTDRAIYNLSWQQLLPTGASYQVQFNNSRQGTNSAFSSFNPLFNSGLFAQASQPLLQNFGLDPAKRQILVAQNTERVSRYQFQTQVLDTVFDVENAYWDLVFSIRDLEVAEQSLQLAKDLLRNNQIQVDVGTMAPIDVLEAEAEVAGREEGVLLAEQAVFQNEDILKSLINDPQSAEFWEVRFAPTDEPTLADVVIDVDDSVRIALQRRPELSSSRVELDTRDHNVRFTKNQKMPQVDVVGSFAVNGLGGNEILRQGFAGAALQVVEGGYSDAVSQVFGGDFRDWSVGLNVSYPLGTSASDAAHAQAQVQYRQQRAFIDATEISVAREVRLTARQVDTNRRRIDATRVARELAARRLDAEEKKFEVGMSTSFFIVQAQRDLAQAAANELRAIIDYNKAITAFERAQGTLLEKANISVR